MNTGKRFSGKRRMTSNFEKRVEKATTAQKRRHAKSVAGKQEKRGIRRRRKDAYGNWIVSKC